MQEYGSLPKRLRRSRLVEQAMQLIAAEKNAQRFIREEERPAWLLLFASAMSF
ncbi:hypothetical protein [Mitsuokella jalaludinii]|uniref:hypothetical protein n=1 Tax=Mitsuokella jalaludinii TaxID=187979 RepID=UPI0030798E1F